MAIIWYQRIFITEQLLICLLSPTQSASFFLANFLFFHDTLSIVDSDNIRLVGLQELLFQTVRLLMLTDYIRFEYYE